MFDVKKGNMCPRSQLCSTLLLWLRFPAMQHKIKSTAQNPINQMLHYLNANVFYTK